MSGKTEKIMGLNTIYEAPRQTGRPGETVVTSTCGHNCGGRCVVNAHVVDGRIARISTDARPWKNVPKIYPYLCIYAFQFLALDQAERERPHSSPEQPCRCCIPVWETTVSLREIRGPARDVFL